MAFVVPEWIWYSLLGVQTLFSLYLITFGILICWNYPSHIFRKAPMTSLYICYFVGITSNMAWAYFKEFSTDDFTVYRYAYLLEEFAKIAMQQSQIIVISEFCCQIRILTFGVDMDKSVSQSFSAEIFEQQSKQESLAYKFTVAILISISVDLCLFAYCLIGLFTNPD